MEEMRIDEEMTTNSEELIDVEEEKKTGKSSAVGIGFGMLIGSGLALAGVAIGKKLMNMLSKDKDDEDFEEYDDSEEEYVEFEEVEENVNQVEDSDNDEEAEQEEN